RVTTSGQATSAGSIWATKGWKNFPSTGKRILTVAGPACWTSGRCCGRTAGRWPVKTSRKAPIASNRRARAPRLNWPWKACRSAAADAGVAVDLVVVAAVPEDGAARVRPVEPAQPTPPQARRLPMEPTQLPAAVRAAVAVVGAVLLAVRAA